MRTATPNRPDISGALRRDHRRVIIEQRSRPVTMPTAGPGEEQLLPRRAYTSPSIFGTIESEFGESRVHATDFVPHRILARARSVATWSSTVLQKWLEHHRGTGSSWAPADTRAEGRGKAMKKLYCLPSRTAARGARGARHLGEEAAQAAPEDEHDRNERPHVHNEVEEGSLGRRERRPAAEEPTLHEYQPARGVHR